MVLNKQLISFPIGSQGMDTDVDPKLNPGVTRSINTVYDREGAVSKRYGSEKVTTDVFTDKYIASYNDHVIVVGDEVTTTPQEWDGDYYTRTYNNDAKFFAVDAYGIGHSQKNIYYYCDVAETVNVTVVGYITKNVSADTYDVYVETFDRVTGIRLDSEVVDSGLSDICFVKVLHIGNTRLGYIYIDDSGVLKHAGINPDTGAISPPAATPGAPACLSTNRQFDADIVWDGASSPYTMVVYPHTDGYRCNIVTIPAFNDALQASTAADLDLVNDHTLLSVAVFSQQKTDGYGTVLCAYDYAEGVVEQVYAVTYDYDCNEVVTAAKVDELSSATDSVLTMAGVADSDTTADIYICWNDISNSNIPYIRKTDFINTSGTGSSNSASDILLRARLATKIGREAETANHYYGVFTKSWGYDYGTQDELLWMDESQNVVGKSLVGRARIDDTTDAYNIMPNVSQVYNGNGYVLDSCLASLIYDDNSSDNKDLYQIKKLQMQTNITDDFPNVVETPVGCFIANSCPYELDESRVHEAGFLQYPEPFSLSAAAGTGLEEGDYHYYLVYEWTDSKGVRHRSRPSPEIGEVTTTSGNTQVSLTCPTLTFTRKENVQIAVYRTRVGPGTRFYRVGTVENDTTVPTVTFTDSTADSEIIYNEAIYTTGNVLPNTQPFSCDISTLWQNRLFYVDRENKKTNIYYTKEYDTATGPGYSSTLLIRCDTTGGAITALAPLLDKLIIFKSDRIYATEGAGLEANNTGTNFISPYLISPNVGCTNKHSIIQIPTGIMFLSSNGIWLLDNSLQLHEIGDPVIHYTDSLDIRGVGKDDENNLVKFYTDGYGLVYNWSRNKWSMWENRECESAIYTGGNTYWMDSSGYLWKEDKDSFVDGSENIYTRVDTGWFSFAQVGGYKRIYKILLIGQKVSAHKLRVRIGYNMDGYYSDTQEFDSSSITAFDVGEYYVNGSSDYDGQQYVLQIYPRHPQCTSIRISIEEYGITGTAEEGWDLSSIAFLVGVKKGTHRIQTGKTFNGV